MNIESLLDKSFVENYRIPKEANYQIEWVDAETLITPKRLDLIVKCKYVEAYEHGYDTSFFFDMYKAHIDAFSNGTFTEPDNPEKNSLEKYITTFHQLIETIKNKEMDDKVSVIPVGADNVIIDGAHRVAASAFFHRRVPIIRFSWISIDYGADFFLKRGLPRGYTDYCTSELIKTYGGKNMHVAILWPRADENRENVETVERIFQEKTELFYKQELDCNYNMIRNLVILCYYHTESREDWLGNFLNCFRGADGKAFCCYARGKTVRVYYFIKDSSEDVLSLKENIRKMFCVGNHSCHISDTPQEAMFIAEMLCNCNSVDLLKYGFPGSVGNLANSLRKIRDMSEKNGVKQGSYVIDSSGVLGLYGMRKVGDLDFISRCPDETLIRGIGDSHNEYLCYYGVSADELTMNPKNYLWFMGMKFSSLEMVKRLKVNRKEDDVSKDVIDVMMIDAVFNKRLGDLYDTYMKFIVSIHQTKKLDVINFVKKFEAKFSQNFFRRETNNTKERDILVISFDQNFISTGLYEYTKNIREKYPLGNIVLVTGKWTEAFHFTHINNVFFLKEIEASKDIVLQLCEMLKLCRKELWEKYFSLCLLPSWSYDADISSFLAFFSGAAKRIGYMEKNTANKMLSSPYKHLINRIEVR